MRRFLLLSTLFALIGVISAVITLAAFGGMPLQASATPLHPAPVESTFESKVAVFNMAAVMREYGKAKYEVYQLNEERKKLSVGLEPKRESYNQIKARIEHEMDSSIKLDLQKKLFELGREIEDKEREINKRLNKDASEVISSIYDEIKSVADKMAEAKGYDIVFAYPDAVGEDIKSAYMKELKLKPPAAQPFFVAKHVDLTEVIIKELNTKHPAPPVPEGAQVHPMPTHPAPSQPFPGRYPE
jgi:Skp family chaperone for outer membrane proteins